MKTCKILTVGGIQMGASHRYESLTDYSLTHASAHLLYANYCVPLSGKAKRVKRKCRCIVIAM